MFSKVFCVSRAIKVSFGIFFSPPLPDHNEPRNLFLVSHSLRSLLSQFYLGRISCFGRYYLKASRGRKIFFETIFDVYRLSRRFFIKSQQKMFNYQAIKRSEPGNVSKAKRKKFSNKNEM